MSKVIYSTNGEEAKRAARKAAREAQKRYVVHAYLDDYEFEERPGWYDIGHYLTYWGAKRRAKFYQDWMGYAVRIIDKKGDE